MSVALASPELRNFASSVHLHCLALDDPVAQDDEEDIDLPSVGFASDPEL